MIVLILLASASAQRFDWSEVTNKPTSYQADWNSTVINKPATFAPSAHPHIIGDVTNLQSTLDAKAPLASPTFTGTVSGITKAMVGLGNVDNTSDASKPISTAVQTALNGKANTFTIPTCNGTDKVTANGTLFSCTPDQTSAGGSGPILLKVEGADYTNSTTSFSDVTGLVSASLPAGTYTINCDLRVSAAAATTGIQIGLNGPATSYLSYSNLYFTSATAVANWTANTFNPTVAQNGTYPVASSAAVISAYRINGQLVTTASGVIAVRAKSEVAASAITIYRGSSCQIF